MNRTLRRALILVTAGLLTLGGAAVPATAGVRLTVACSQVSDISFMFARVAVCLYREGDRWSATGLFWYRYTQTVLNEFSVTLSHSPLGVWEVPLSQSQCGPVFTRGSMECSTNSVALDRPGAYIVGRLTVGLDHPGFHATETFSVWFMPSGG
jgi:hypothetical protein